MNEMRELQKRLFWSIFWPIVALWVVHFVALAMADTAKAGDIPHRYMGDYKGALSVLEVPYGQAGQMCRKLNKKHGLPRNPLMVNGRHLYGCALVFNEGSCLIVVSKPSALNMYPGMRKDVFEHELAHCKGWPANHPS